jgi:hypothetical protein
MAPQYQARSARFRTMEIELRALRQRLLPQRFSPTGQYPDRIYTRTHAYCVLAHAEFESYVEDRVVELVKASVDAWRNYSIISKAAACLLTFSEKKREEMPKTITPLPKNLSARLRDAGDDLRALAGRNHGIRESNLLSLLLPIGIEPDAFTTGVLGSTGWLTHVDNFGSARGDTAHRSASNRARMLPDPRTEYTIVSTILLGFREIN